MQSEIRRIILSATNTENAESATGELNTDVIVQMNSGELYVATFCSYRCMESIIERHREASDEQRDDHYAVLNVVLVNDSVSRDVLPVVEHMMAEGDFQLVFKKM